MKERLPLYYYWTTYMYLHDPILADWGFNIYGTADTFCAEGRITTVFDEGKETNQQATSWHISSAVMSLYTRC